MSGFLLKICNGLFASLTTVKCGWKTDYWGNSVIRHKTMIFVLKFQKDLSTRTKVITWIAPMTILTMSYHYTTAKCW